MNRDTFSHIRLWCPRPFGTYSQNKPYGGGTGGSGPAPSLCKADAMGRTSIDGGGGNGPEDDEDAGTENTPPTTANNMQPPPPPAPPSPTTQVEDGRVLLDTWYVIKPGNTKEKIAFFVAHQFSGTGLPRPSAMKVKGNWATDCTKAKRRRRCSSYDPPARAPSESSPADMVPTEDGLGGVSETDLLSVAEMVALVEQRTAMALQGMVVQGQTTTSSHHHQHPQVNNVLPGSDTDTGPVVYMSEDTSSLPDSSSDLDEQQQEPEQQLNDTRRVAQAVAHYESQQSVPENVAPKDQVPVPGGAPPKATHGRGEVRIAFRVSSLDSRSQSEPAGRPRCMFMSCGSGGAQTGARAKEKITCDLYQLVSPSSRDPSLLLAGPQKSDAQGEANPDRPPSASSATPDPNPDLVPAEKKNVSRERVTGFHVEVVVTGAVDQCVFYGKDSTENVQEETVCFGKPGGGGSSSDVSEDPPPGQLFFLQPPTPDEEIGGKGMGMNGSLDCANNNNTSSSSNGPAIINGGGSGNGTVIGTAEQPDSPLPGVEDSAGGDSSSSLCRLYRHVSHDFLEIRFQIQRLLEPRQYMLSLPDHIMVNIFSYLPTRSLAALKCTCHDFKALIEMYGVRATDSRWNQDPLYRDDPCKQCKRQYERGDVSLCRWHPKPYHHDLPYGRSYWMCCRRTDKDTPGCRVGLHDNNWVQPCDLVQTRSKRDDGR